MAASDEVDGIIQSWGDLVFCLIKNMEYNGDIHNFVSEGLSFFALFVSFYNLIWSYPIARHLYFASFQRNGKGHRYKIRMVVFISFGVRFKHCKMGKVNRGGYVWSIVEQFETHGKLEVRPTQRQMQKAYIWNYSKQPYKSLTYLVPSLTFTSPINTWSH